MAEPYQRQSALAHLGLAARAAADQDKSDAGVRLGERAFPGQLNLRGDPANEAFMDAVAGVIGRAPPTVPNTWTGKDGTGKDDAGEDPRTLWLAPGEWLIVTAADAEDAPAGKLAAAVADHGGSVVDVGDARTVLVLHGPNARDVLMKGCPLDLHPDAFRPGDCAQSLLARAAVILCRRKDDADAGASFEIHVARSFAAYLWAWLEDAAGEYGVQVIET